MTTLSLRSLLTVFILSLILLSCKKDPESKPGSAATNPGNATIAGVAMNQQKQPLAGVSIRCGTAVAVSDNEGKFSFDNVAVKDNRVVVSAEKDGFFDVTMATVPSKEKTTQFRLVMPERKIVATFNSANGATGTTEGNTIRIPANGVVNADGSAFSGNVRMAARYISPESPSLSSLMPGGDFLANDKDQREVTLYTYGAIEVELENSAGQALQLKTGNEATLTMPIAASQLATAPATIPLWYFDTQKNKWMEEGVATRQGNKYVGNVKHFTPWNLDFPEQVARIEGKLTKCDGSPVGYTIVNVGQYGSITDQNGNYSLRVAANTPYRASISNGDGNGSVTDSFDVAPIPGETTKTINYKLKCEVIVKGQIVNEQNVPKKGSVIFSGSDGTRSIITDDQGRFTENVKGNISFTVEASADGETSVPVNVTTPATGEVNLGKVIVKPTAPGNSSYSFTMNGAGFTNKQVEFSETFDPNDTEGIYSLGLNTTIMLKVSSDMVFNVSFLGRQPGDYDAVISIRLPGHKALSVQTGGLTITTYGPVGGVIAGRFSGTFVYYDEQTNQQLGTVQITNGKFNLHHTEDAP